MTFTSAAAQEAGASAPAESALRTYERQVAQKVGAPLQQRLARRRRRPRAQPHYQSLHLLKGGGLPRGGRGPSSRRRAGWASALPHARRCCRAGRLQRRSGFYLHGVSTIAALRLPLLCWVRRLLLLLLPLLLLWLLLLLLLLGG